MSFLIKPPVLGQCAHFQQQSARISSESRNNSAKKSKNQKKESSLLNKNNINKIAIENNNNYDNASVKSHNSANSSKSKKKQTTLKIQKQPLKINTPFIEDSNVHKNDKQMYEKSEVRQFFNNEQKQFNQSPVMKHFKNSKEKKEPEHVLSKCSPFSQINDKDSQQEVPIYQITQPTTKRPQNYQILTNQPTLRQQNQSLLAKKEQKQKKKKIFANIQSQSQKQSSFNNDNSQISNQRGQSKSKLGNLLKQTRERRAQQQSRLNEQYSTISIGSIRQDSKISIKPSVSKEKLVKIQHIDLNDDDKFDFEGSDLDLSQSHKPNNIINNKDKQSVCFQFQPSKKKGISLSSKQTPKLIKIQGELTSKILQNVIVQQNNDNKMIQISGNLVSKGFERQKLLNKFKQNQQFLKKSGLAIDNQKRQQLNVVKQQIIKKQHEKQEQKQVKKQLEKIQAIPTYQPYLKEKKNNEVIKESEKLPTVASKIQKIQIIKTKETKIRDIPQYQSYQQQSQIYNKYEQKQSHTQKYQYYQEPPKKNDIVIKQEPKPIVYTSLNNAPSTFSKDVSSQKSHSKSNQKNKKKKQVTIQIKKSFKLANLNACPKGQQSFYQNESQNIDQSNQQSSKKNPKILSFSQSQGQDNNNKKTYTGINFYQQQQLNSENIKSQTDVNFYTESVNQSRKKPPSSKPPLSKKSVASSSNSKQKIKESSVGRQNPNQKLKKDGSAKKLSLMDLAMKRNQSNESQSPSINSKDSRNSKNSNNSRKSSKKQGVVRIKETKVQRTPIKDYHYQAQPSPINILQRRKIVCKDVPILNQRGVLVKKDIVIEGNKLYGIPTQQSLNEEAYDKMKRLRNRKRSRDISRSRSRSNSQSKNSFYEKGLREKRSISNKFQQDSSFDESCYGNRERNTNSTLSQFMKPIQQILPLQAKKLQAQFYDQQPNPAPTLNDLFSKKANKKTETLKTKKGMPRTQKIKNQ